MNQEQLGKIHEHHENAKTQIDKASALLARAERPKPNPRPKPDPPRDRPKQEIAVRLDNTRWATVSPDRPWTTIGGWLHVRGLWDDYGAHVIVSNSYPGMGARHVERIDARVNGKRILKVRPLSGRTIPLPPKWAYIGSECKATAEHWVEPGETPRFPWAERKAPDEIGSHSTNKVLDRATWWYDRDLGAVAGHGVAQHCGGAMDWLSTGPAGRALHWAQVLGEGATNFHCVDPETGDPLYRNTPWWTGNSMNPDLHLPGYKWSPKTSDEHTLVSRYRCHDGAHLRRIYGQLSALASRSAVARYLLKMLWTTYVKQEWSMDPGYPVVSEGSPGFNYLLAPLWQRIELSRRGGSQAPLNYCAWGDRATAHAVNCFVETAPYLDPIERTRYANGFEAFLLNIMDAHGNTNRGASGGAAGWGQRYGMTPPFAYTFHSQLVVGAANHLARRFGMRVLSNRVQAYREFMDIEPPYNGFEAGPDSTQPRMTERGVTSKTGDDSRAYAAYSLFVHRKFITNNAKLANMRSIEGLSATESLTGLPTMDCVPPELWGEGR